MFSTLRITLRFYLNIHISELKWTRPAATTDSHQRCKFRKNLKWILPTFASLLFSSLRYEITTSIFT